MSNKNYRILDKFQEKLLVECSICGRIDIKSCSEIENYDCATCRKFYVNNINKDSEELSKIMATTNADLSANKIQCNKRYFSSNMDISEIREAHKVLSSRYEIIGVLYQKKNNKYNTDSYYIQTDSIVCKCKKCGTIKFIKVNDAGKVSMAYCNKCKDGYNDKNNEESKVTWEKMKKIVTDINNRADSKTHVKSNYNTKLLDKKRKELKKIKRDTSEHEIKTISPRVSDKMNKAFDKIRQLNPDFDIEGFTVNGAEYTVKCSCNKCGSDISIASSLKKKQVECEGCKTLRVNPNYRGVYLKNNVNTCKNDMIVTRDFGKKVEVTCRLCSAKYVVSKYDWMYGNIYCDMDHDLLDATIICDSCGNYPVLKTSEVIKYRGDGTDAVICSCCKNPIMHIDDNGEKVQLTYGDIISDMAGVDSSVTRSKNFGLAIKELKSTTSTVNNLCRSNKILYVNKNGERYYNCRCLEHNQNMILSDNEIDNFNHSQCYDVRNLIINDNIIRNVKIR